jgi:hypothetical protein
MTTTKEQIEKAMKSLRFSVKDADKGHRDRRVRDVQREGSRQ